MAMHRSASLQYMEGCCILISAGRALAALLQRDTSAEKQKAQS
jgi:hypothetical protein